MPLSAEERSNRAQTARRKQMLDQGYSSDCAHAMHARCHLESCICKCHKSERQAAPKRPEIRAAKAALPAVKMRQVKSEFALVLWAADQLAARSVPNYWQTPADRLEEHERTALVDASYAELEARFPKALEWLAKASESATEAALLYTIAIVAAPRLARHGVISNELATAILFAPIALANATATEPAASVEPNGAPMPDRPNGNGQVYPGVPPFEVPPVQGGAAVETGSGDVPDPADHPHRGGNGRHPL
jgi:hypothetical protein